MTSFWNRKNLIKTKGEKRKRFRIKLVIRFHGKRSNLRRSSHNFYHRGTSQEVVLVLEINLEISCKVFAVVE